MSSILLKLVKCSRALHASLRVRHVAPIECFAEFLLYTALSTQPATHVAVMREAYSHHYGCQVEQYIAETCKMQNSFTCTFKGTLMYVLSVEFFTEFLQYTALSTQPATSVGVMREAHSHHYGCQS